MSKVEPRHPNNGWTTVMAIAAATLAALAVAKFVVIKPIVFLALALVLGISAWYARQGRKGATITLVVANLLVTVIFGAHLLDKGLDPDRYQHVVDFISVLIGLPAAVIGLVASVLHLKELPSSSGSQSEMTA